MKGSFLKWLFWRYFRVFVAMVPPKIVYCLTIPTAFFQLIVLSGRAKITYGEQVASKLIVDRNSMRTTHKAFKSQLDSQISMCYLSKINKENIDEWIPTEGLQNIEEASKKANGVILLNPHFGPFMLLMSALGHRGYKINQVALQGDPLVGKRRGMRRLAYEASFNAIEKKLPVNFINAADSNMAIRKAIRRLMHNEIVLFASTGRGGTSWHNVSFLNRRANFNLIPFKIAIRLGSAVLPVFLFNSKPFAKLLIEKNINISRENTPEKMLENYVSILESYVKQYPENFAFYLYDMRIKAGWDDHPLFDDYSLKDKHPSPKNR